MDFRRQLSAELPVLRRFARALTGDPALADDLVQDCLERAMLKSHLYDASRPLRAWLFTMLRNLHISGIRRSSRATVVKTVDEALKDLDGATSAADSNAFTIKAPIQAENGAVVPISVSTTRDSIGCCKDQTTGPTAPLARPDNSKATGAASSSRLNRDNPVAESVTDHTGGRLDTIRGPDPTTNSSGNTTRWVAPTWSKRFKRI